MNQHRLGRLEKIDPRNIWKNEAGDFTPWLAEEENLELLGETIGLELEPVSTEHGIGPYRADIVCKDTVDDTWVLIENQLERTDHVHLGQLLTYAAGLNAVTIVWIAHRFTDEHRAALDWLNEITDSNVNFFGLEIELWQIANSPIAPKFNIASKPNDWIKRSPNVTRGELTETQQLQLEYWQEFIAYLDEAGSFLRIRTPRPQHSLNFAIGRSGFQMTALIRTAFEQRIALQLVIHKGDVKAFFHLLYQDKERVEAELGESLEWREQPDNKRSYITLYNEHFDPSDRTQWLEQYAWFHNKLEAFHKIFSHRIKTLNADDYIAEMDETEEVETKSAI